MDEKYNLMTLSFISAFTDIYEKYMNNVMSIFISITNFRILLDDSNAILMNFKVADVGIV